MARRAKPTYFRTGPLVEFGRRVRAFRTARGLSQEKLAHRADTHTTYVSRTECGEQNVSILNLQRLAEALDVDPGMLLTRESGLYRRALAATKAFPAPRRR